LVGKTRLGQFLRWRILVHDAHLEGEGVANDQAQGVQGRRNQQLVGPVQFVAEMEEACVDAHGDERVREGQERPL
jgi:hypothetical protein